MSTTTILLLVLASIVGGIIIGFVIFALYFAKGFKINF